MGVLSVEDVNHLSIAVPNGECLVDIDACAGGLGVSFWMRLKGLISFIIGDQIVMENKLKGWLDGVTSPGMRWVNCYRATEHGWDASAFHSRCDFKGPTVTLVEVNKFIFGGFTDLDWGGSTGFKRSSSSFLFTLRNMDNTAGVKLGVQNAARAIYNDPSYGPYFGNGDLVIGDMAAKNLNSSSHLGTSYSLPNDVIAGSVEAFNHLAGSEYFLPDEVEVFHIECFHPLGMENGDILDDQITQATGSYKGGDVNNAPWQARLNNPTGNTFISASPNSVLVVDLRDVHRILGIDAHGNNKFPSKPGYPTDFNIKYEWPSGSWQAALSGLSLDNGFSIKRFLFIPSFITRKLTFELRACENSECGFAIEIYGCSAESCDQALRMVNITASSSSPQYQPSESGIDSSLCWKPSTDNDPNDYLQVDLGRVKVLTGVVTKEAASLVYVESYKIQYSIDGVKWKYYPNFDGTPKVFTGGSGLVTVTLEPVVQVRFVRFYPVSGDKCVKLELRGCLSIKGESAGILSSGSNPKDETGLLIYSSSKLKAQYHTLNEDCYTKAQPLPSTEWARFTFMLKNNKDTRIFLNNARVSPSNEHPSGFVFPLNSAKVVNLASSLSSFQWWSVENIQLSDLSLWIDITSDGSWDDWAENLPDVLDLCNFDDTPCPWKIGNWTLGKECVPSNSLGTGPCQDKDGAPSFYIHLESSYPRSKGESVRFESPYVISSYKCVAFWYHMWGEYIGRLNVFLVDRLGSEKLLWRLSGDQGNSWNEGKIRVNRGFAFKVIFEAVVGDGFLGDIAMDEVQLLTTSCTIIPSNAKPGVSTSLYECEALGMENGAITDGQISASSAWSNYDAHLARLNNNKGWSVGVVTNNEWLQIDLGCGKPTVTRIATQGLENGDEWVTEYKLDYGNDEVNFQYYREQGQIVDKVFTGNTDRNTVVSHDLNPPITARYIRFRPEYQIRWIAMRVELYKCPASSVPGLDKSAIIGHLDGFKSFLLQALSDAGSTDKIWVPCYRAITNGRDVAEFYSRCAGKEGTVTIVRSDNFIFGGYTDKDWDESRG
ncbi:neuropilin-1a-like [Oculina patagonica]